MASTTLPSAYECELETLIRDKDKQIAHLKAENASLRPRINSQQAPASATVTAALTQRAKVLQEENEQLYDLLKLGQTGKLKEQVHGLKSVIKRLEAALKASQDTISHLSTELDKSYETFTSHAPKKSSVRSVSPQNSRYSASNGLSSSGYREPKLPTAPRAHKKQRVAEPSHPPTQPKSQHRPPSSSSRSHSGSPSRHNASMELDEDTRSVTSDRRDKDYERDSHRGDSHSERSRKDKYRDRDREDSSSRKHGSQGKSGSRSGRKQDSGSLAERIS
ncbi:hypothetical protein DL96DRAFT_1592977 [Flagelloscypha sp. PMI_526]|nr:hypothetical protein DL96DRAFT_1592977 [Flagelloscypha sp. PMI_526]